MTAVIGPASLTNTTTASTITLDTGVPTAYHSILVTGTFTGTLIAEASNDGGVTWVAMKLSQTSTAGTVASDVVSAAGHYSMPAGVVVQNFRVRATAMSSGAALVTLLAA